MIKIGKWKGQYSFFDQKVNKIRGFDKTLFKIEISSVNGNSFKGKIEDDLNTGGMEGVGEILGEIIGNRIEFVKVMPKMTLLVDRKGTRKTYNKKHQPIFYTGQFSSDGQTVSGTWRFKFGFIWIWIIPVPVIPSKGIWSMTREE
ncbi:hypothetical protein EGI22_20855 [Lacihabitans sp. LS3-19]|uniref:hypothetical protein n=1 Tax=Lacihabitans sp. LS3-19 TaxID=2487335 RepID=UPI0020CC95D6|nr:hypothetical protein [Lacihabitans sp. LS3-19]MCP9770364.1 hypothetical protein [Lacihabitans sp. LS3-19]